MVNKGVEEQRVAGILVRVTPTRRQAIFDEVERISTASPSFFLLVAASTIIAAYGLLANSTAVIIGAMLVAPLMGPIFGVALGLSVGDQRLLGRSLLSELAGMTVVIIMAMLIGLVPVRLGFGDELIARTQPTLYDMVIALASGIAGAYALVDEHLNAALPGVAISVSLVPPLATCGLSLATMRYEWALGALLLFLANFLAIHVVAAVVFMIFGVKNIRLHQELTVFSFFRRFTLSLLSLAAVAVFLTQTLITVYNEHRLSNEVQKVLSYQVRSRVGAELSDFRAKKYNDQVEILATVLTPNPFEPNEVAQIEKILQQEVDPRIHLVLRSLTSKDYDCKGPVYVPKEELEHRAQVAQQSVLLRKVSQSINEQLRKVPGARLGELQLEPQKDHIVVTAEVFTPGVIEPAKVAEIETALRQAVNESVHLIVRSILTRDADPQHYIYEAEKTPKRLTGEDLKFHVKLEQALRDQLKANVKGASLVEFRYVKKDGRLLLLAVVRTPQNIAPGQVSRMQGALRPLVDPTLTLVVRSMVGVDASDRIYLSDFDETVLLPQKDNVKVPK
jgi:uncharacterized hydrophobic protein (TIGR00271 family)